MQSTNNQFQGRLLPNELLFEMNQFMPLNGLIKCGQANRILSALGIPRARKVHAKLISLYFEDVSTLAIWFKQWARQLAEVRANIHRRMHYIPFLEDLGQFYDLLHQIYVEKILKTDHAVNILALFNFPLAYQIELRQIRASHIEKAFAPAKFELSQWQPENNPNWHEMLTRFGGLMRTNWPEQLNDFFRVFFNITHNAKQCANQLKMMARHLNRRS